MFRFLHAADLHLGKPFGGFDEDVRAALRRARHEAIAGLAGSARAAGARHVLLAGDTFDTQTPSPVTIRHALNVMASADDLVWVLLPGNHDSLAAGELWRVLAADRPTNVVLAVDPEPLDLGGATLLPAPCPVRHPGRDLTEWFGAADTGSAIRVGLAHGTVRDFAPSEIPGSSGARGVIPPERARFSRLDFLALGDWHGQVEIGPATWYSGTPEPDSFKAHAPAGALAVEIPGPGATPRVAPVPLAHYVWRRIEIALDAAENGPVETLGRALPPLEQRARTLADLRVAGHAGLAARRGLERAIEGVRADFLHLESDLSALVLARDLSDLDQISTHGALRQAAETLAAEAEAAADASARRAAADALAMLFAYRTEAS